MAETGKHKAVRNKGVGRGKGGGPKPKFKLSMLPQVRKLIDLGATDFELADFMGITVRTWYKWMAAHPKLRQAVMDWKKAADRRVERSLYQRAIGYSHADEVIRVLSDGTVVRVETVKHYPPDPGAAFNWLKNRLPAEWRDRIELEDGDARGRYELLLEQVRQLMENNQVPEIQATEEGDGSELRYNGRHVRH